MRCPTCKRPVDEREWRPFCSERCKLLDLARWLDGDYRVPGEPAAVPEAHPDEDEDPGE